MHLYLTFSSQDEFNLDNRLQHVFQKISLGISGFGLNRFSYKQLAQWSWHTASHWNLGPTTSWFTVLTVSVKFKPIHRDCIAQCEEKVDSVKNSRNTVSLRFISSYTMSIGSTVWTHTHRPDLCPVRMTCKEYGNGHHLLSEDYWILPLYLGSCQRENASVFYGTW